MNYVEEWAKFLRRKEGLRLRAYQCPAGVWTIGYGHTGPEVTPGLRWTLDQASYALAEDMNDAIADALRWSPGLAGESVRLIAVADFIFNCGPGAYAKSQLRRRVNAKDWEGAAAQNARWVFGGGRRLPGLVARREITSKWFRENSV